jgi:hypothetical protein
MSFRTVILIAAAIVGIASTATLSLTEAFASVPARTTRLHHRHHHGPVQYSAQLHYPYGGGLAGNPVGSGSPYCWPYDAAFNPYEYCGASYIVSW